MRVRKSINVRLRKDVFGGVAYVSRRDDFFALDGPSYSTIAALSYDWSEIKVGEEDRYKAFAALGICETDPETPHRAYSGPSFIGKFIELPTVTDPLVLNCFSTAFCPLKCRYCHADDLMMSYRESENLSEIDNVVSTASMIPALVAVITGGDPLSSPERAARLIERLSKQKSIVLDTSGVGDINRLLPVLISSKAHIRVSLDSISEVNDKVRLSNPKFVKNKDASRLGARATIAACLENDLPVTVQTVVSSYNENITELIDLRDQLYRWGVKNWVLHVAIRGGLARKIEAVAEKQTRKRGILPSANVYGLVEKVIEDTTRQRIPIDIRCTDTDQTPNSVLLVASTGDLFTEGLAHHGKVPLYRAGEGRPDLVRSLWHHVDRFGHARRYFNWNPWLNRSRNLEDICISIPEAANLEQTIGSAVETEAKYAIRDSNGLIEALVRNGFVLSGQENQRDEYYDRSDRAFSNLDFVIRLRDSHGRPILGIKGPRFFTQSGEYSRIELEFEPKSYADAIASLEEKQLSRFWFFEKSRATYRQPQSQIVVSIDAIPLLGEFLEIEGSIQGIRSVYGLIQDFIGPAESRNYGELVKDYLISEGVPPDSIKGVEFPRQNPT